MRLKFPSPLAQYIYNSTHDEDGKRLVDRHQWNDFLENINADLIQLLIQRLPTDRKKLLEPNQQEEASDALLQCVDEREASEEIIRQRLEEAGLTADYAMYERIAVFLGRLQTMERSRTYADLNTPCENIERFLKNYFGVNELELIEYLKQRVEQIEKESVDNERETEPRFVKK